MAFAVLVAGILSWAEWVHWRSSVRNLGTSQRLGGSEAIVVLGFRNGTARANHVNRYRARAALRSIDPRAASTVLVLCGGPVGGPVPEADLLAAHLRDRLGYPGPMLLDRTSTTTWENIAHAIPLIESADTIKIVSNSLHAELGRAYLRKQRPDLAGRLMHAEEHRFGELALVKPLAAFLGLRARRSRRTFSG